MKRSLKRGLTASLVVTVFGLSGVIGVAQVVPKDCIECGPLNAAPLIDTAQALVRYRRCGIDRLNAAKPRPEGSARSVAEGVADACEDALKPIAAAAAAAGKNEADVQYDLRAERERATKQWTAEVLRLRRENN